MKNTKQPNLSRQNGLSRSAHMFYFRLFFVWLFICFPVVAETYSGNWRIVDSSGFTNRFTGSLVAPNEWLALAGPTDPVAGQFAQFTTVANAGDLVAMASFVSGDPYESPHSGNHYGVRIFEYVEYMGEWVQMGGTPISTETTEPYGVFLKNAPTLAVDAKQVLFTPDGAFIMTTGDGWIKIFGEAAGNWIQVGADIPIPSGRYKKLMISDDGQTVGCGFHHTSGLPNG